MDIFNKEPVRKAKHHAYTSDRSKPDELFRDADQARIKAHIATQAAHAIYNKPNMTAEDEESAKQIITYKVDQERTMREASLGKRGRFIRRKI